MPLDFTRDHAWLDYPLHHAMRAKRDGCGCRVGARATRVRAAPAAIPWDACLLMLVYSLVLGGGLILSAPWWLARMASTERYREGLSQRLGRVPAGLRAACAGKRVVWVHAVSVGEVLAVSRLLEELQETLLGTLPSVDRAQAPEARKNNDWQIVLSTTTRTGQQLARKRFRQGGESPATVFYFPLDFAFAVRAYLRALRPALLVLAESELWPRTLHECTRAGVPVAVVNARVSDRSFRRTRGVRKLWQRMARHVSLWLAQSELDAERLRRLGAAPERVRVSGNLKYDTRTPGHSALAERLRKLAGERPVLVAGSTVSDEHCDEDALVIQAWEGELRTRWNVLLVLAPRHPERFRAVHAQAAAVARTRLATELLTGDMDPGGDASEGSEASSRVDIVVLNTIGDLAAVYGVATAAFVGGSLAPRGGHNPLEPAQFSVPVILGPSFENFHAVVENMRAADAIAVLETQDATTRSVSGRDNLLRTTALEAAFTRLLKSPEQARAMGERGRRVFEQQGGATARTVAALLPLLGLRQGAGR